MKTTMRSPGLMRRWPLWAFACVWIAVILTGGTLAHGAPPALRMPFSSADGERWSISTGYNGAASHKNNDLYALDFNLPGSGDHGKPILAVAAGEVTVAGWSAPLPGNDFAYGYRVYVDHGGGYVSIYAHLDVITVAVGQSVVQGQVVGLCGTSGAGPNNYHLHFALQHNGNAYKPEPMSGQSGFIEGMVVRSDNVVRRPVGVMAGQYGSAVAASVTQRFLKDRSNLGWPVDDGGGVLLHEWGFDPAQRGSWKWGGHYIQNFDGGAWGACALIYNRITGKTYTLRGGFWNVFRYGVGDGSGWGPTIAVAGKQLGFPESDPEPSAYGISQQRFSNSNGTLVWDGHDVHLYTKDGQKFLTTSDNGPIFALSTRPVSSSRVRLSFPTTANAATYQVWINGLLAGAVSAQSAQRTAMQTATVPEESVTISGMSPGMTIGVQVRAVDQQGSELSRSPMAVAQSLQDFVSIEPVASILTVKADEPFALAVDAAGPSLLSFTWYCNGVLRATNSVPELYLDSAGWKEAGTWTVVARDQFGQTASTKIRVRVSNLEFGHWQKAHLFSGSGIVSQYANRTGGDSTSADDNWKAYAVGASGDPAIAISDMDGPNAVLQVKRLYQPRDILYVVDQKEDLLAGWSETVSETTAAYIGPSSEPPYGIWELYPATASAARAFFTARAEAAGRRELILYDDFEDKLLDASLWNWQRHEVEETEGVLHVRTTVADHGGQAWTASFPIGNGTIEIVRRAKVRYGNEYSMPRLALRYLDQEGKYRRACGIFYANMIHSSSTHVPAHGVFLGLGSATPHIRDKKADTVEGPPVLWNTWFVEKLSFDNSTGLVRYSVNGTEVMNGYAPTIDPASEVSVYIDAWGWWTGHQNLSDYLEVYRSKM